MDNSNLICHTDTQGRKWLVSVIRSDKKLHIPRDIHGVSPGAFAMARNIKEIYIPLSVAEIGGDVFGVFDENTTIYCRAVSKPDGWEDSETVLDSDDGYERLHNYWLGSAKFTFDGEGVLSYIPLRYRNGAPKVIWGYDL